MADRVSQVSRRPRVVVVGGGFAGLAAVRALRGADVDVLLLDRAPYTTFQPLLYQWPPGDSTPGDITFGLRAFASRHPNARFRRATVTGVDTTRRVVGLEGGDAVGYDHLVLACGVGANYFGVPAPSATPSRCTRRARRAPCATGCSPTWRRSPRTSRRPSSWPGTVDVIVGDPLPATPPPGTPPGEQPGQPSAGSPHDR